MPWKRRAISAPWKCGKGSYTVEVGRVVQSWLAALSTRKDSYALEVEKFQHCGSMKGYAELVCCIVYYKSSYTMEAGRVIPSWLGAASTINWLHQVP